MKAIYFLVLSTLDVLLPVPRERRARLVDKKVEEMEHFALADMRQIIASICKGRSTTEIESKKGSGTGDKCDPLASWQRLIIKR